MLAKTLMFVPDVALPAAVRGSEQGAKVLLIDKSRGDLGDGNVLMASGSLRDWAPRAFSEFAQERPLHALGTRGYPWIEIDFPEDYQRAIRDVLPAIDGAAARPGARLVS